MQTPEMLDNVSRTVKDDLATEITKGDKLSIAAACFSAKKQSAKSQPATPSAPCSATAASPALLKKSTCSKFSS